MLSIATLVSYLIPAVIVFVILKIISIPLKMMIKFLINLIIGGIVLVFFVNIGLITIPITWWMAALVGVFGIPGAVAVLIISFII